jgi:hypothetical protein
MRKDISFLALSTFVLIAILGLVGCAIGQQSSNPLIYPETLPALGYTFDYAPVQETTLVRASIALIDPTYSNSTSAGISFTILDDSVKLAATNDEEIKKICADYLNSIKSDFNETLIAKGFTLLGPFSNFGEMTYGEKEKSNLALLANVNLKFQFIDTTGQNNVEIFSQRTKSGTREVNGKIVLCKSIQIIGKFSGSLIADGFIELVLVEPLTGEKMWIKQIKIPFEKEPYYYYIQQEGMQNIDIIGNPVGDMVITNTELLKENDFRPRALAKALEKIYISQLDLFSKYFDPKEISFVIKDAEKVRKLKRY